MVTKLLVKQPADSQTNSFNKGYLCLRIPTMNLNGGLGVQKYALAVQSRGVGLHPSIITLQTVNIFTILCDTWLV